MALRQVALHSLIRVGHEGQYVDDHANIPDDLVETFARIGIHNWAIWRSGRHLFHLVSCDDFNQAMSALEADPANQRWQQLIGTHVERFLPDAEPQPLDEVWSLAQQRLGNQAS